MSPFFFPLPEILKQRVTRYANPFFQCTDREVLWSNWETIHDLPERSGRLVGRPPRVDVEVVAGMTRRRHPVEGLLDDPLVLEVIDGALEDVDRLPEPDRLDDVRIVVARVVLRVGEAGEAGHRDVVGLPDDLVVADDGAEGPGSVVGALPLQGRFHRPIHHRVLVHAVL